VADVRLHARRPRDLHRRPDLQHDDRLRRLDPGTDWTWEAFVNHGESHTFARQTGIYSLERTQSVLSAPAFGRGWRSRATRNRAASALDRPLHHRRQLLQSRPGGVSNDCLEAIRADLKNRSKMRQTIAEVNLQGGLFALPAGDVRFALGASYRELGLRVHQRHADHPGPLVPRPGARHLPERQRLRLLDTKEVYGELLIPVLADTPFFHELNLEVGGRMSDYSTTGTSYTYKALADWAVTDWLRLRAATTARSARRTSASCSSRRSRPSASTAAATSARGATRTASRPTRRPTPANAAHVEAVCRALMNQAGPDAINLFYGRSAAVRQSPAGFGFAFLTSQATETCVRKRPTPGRRRGDPVAGRRRTAVAAALSVDFYDISIKDAIGAQNGDGVQRQCYDPAFNPAVRGRTTADHRPAERRRDHRFAEPVLPAGAAHRQACSATSS
jgi:hypothetical protein